MLDQARPIASERKDASAAAAAPRAKLRLLVIDDDKLHRMIICRAAARAGYASAAAATCAEAVKLFQSTASDCITLDLSNGRNAGVEMLQHLWLSGCKVPIIGMICDGVACAETLKFARSLQLNIWETISKPVDLALLTDLFERLKAECRTPAVAAA